MKNSTPLPEGQAKENQLKNQHNDLNQNTNAKQPTQPKQTNAICNTLLFEYPEGDVLDLFPEAIVNLVSCTGIKRNSTNHRLAKAYPQYAKEYKRLCLRRGLQVTKPHVYDLGTLFGTRYIISLPVKEHWKENLQPAIVKLAIAKLLQCVADLGPQTLAFPLFQGPPVEWITTQFKLESIRHQGSQLSQLFLFREE